MNPGEKIKLLKRLSAQLAKLEWSDIDLHLRQFGFPWSDEWSGDDRAAYCIEFLERGTDESLQQLQEYLFEEGNPGPKEEESSWEAGRFRLFISHLSAKKAEMVQVKSELSAYGIDAFVAHKDIEPTREWVLEIEQCLSSCDAMAAFLVPGFADSPWTDQEVGYCYGRRVLVVPVRLGLDPYGLIQRYQGLTPTLDAPEVIARELFEILISHDLTSGKMAEALVRKFGDSESFAEAKTNLALVRKIKVWTPDLLRALEEAPNKNGQVRESWGVPEGVRALVAKYSK